MYKLVSTCLVSFVSFTQGISRDDLRDALSAVITDSDDIARLDDYLSFVEQFNKLSSIDVSDSDELKLRFSNWKETDDSIRLKSSDSTTRGFILGHTRFSDWTASEKQAILLDAQYTSKSATELSNCLQVDLTDSSVSSDATASLIKSNSEDEEISYDVDNRAYDIAGIQDQGSCASCWDFSDVATLEMNRNLDFGLTTDSSDDSTDEFVKLSEQMVLDCISDGIGTCDGGYPLLTLMWVSENDGISKSSDYASYSEVEGTCDASVSRSEASVFDQMYCLGTESVSQVSMAASTFSVEFAFKVYSEFYNYESGVYSCDTSDEFLGWHAVTIVGVTKDYFIVKNSWSTEWGDEGYFYMNRDSFDDCAMSHFAFVSFHDLESALSKDEKEENVQSSSLPVLDVAQVAQVRADAQEDAQIVGKVEKSEKIVKNVKNVKNDKKSEDAVNVLDDAVDAIELEAIVRAPVRDAHVPVVDKIKVKGSGNEVALIAFGAIALLSVLTCVIGMSYKKWLRWKEHKAEKAIEEVRAMSEQSALLDGYVAL